MFDNFTSNSSQNLQLKQIIEIPQMQASVRRLRPYRSRRVPQPDIYQHVCQRKKKSKGTFQLESERGRGKACGSQKSEVSKCGISEVDADVGNGGGEIKSCGIQMKIPPEASRLNNTKGGRIKEAKSVIKHRLELNKSSKLNVNNRIETFGLIVKDFNETKRQWVIEMGFEGLFSLAGKGLPRTLCYWLATRVDVIKKAFLTADGKEFPLSKVQVHWIFGIPIGPKAVPERIIDDEMKREVDRIWDQYSTTSPSGTRGITRKSIMEVVEGPCDDANEFKKAFLMLALCDVLCPTTCHRLTVKMLPAVTRAQNASQYDWCSVLLDHLLHSLESFGKRFYNDGFAKGLGGCTFFLVILYLDRLRRPPVQWGVFPRMRAWTNSEINKAKVDDRLITGDFGQLGCVDVAYGERHPLQARDVMPTSTSIGPVEQVMPVLRAVDKPMVLVDVEHEISNTPRQLGNGRKRRKATTCYNPYQYKLMKDSARSDDYNLVGSNDSLKDSDIVDNNSMVESLVEYGAENVERSTSLCLSSGAEVANYKWGASCSMNDRGVITSAGEDTDQSGKRESTKEILSDKEHDSKRKRSGVSNFLVGNAGEKEDKDLPCSYPLHDENLCVDSSGNSSEMLNEDSTSCDLMSTQNLLNQANEIGQLIVKDNDKVKEFEESNVKMHENTVCCALIEGKQGQAAMEANTKQINTSNDNIVILSDRGDDFGKHIEAHGNTEGQAAEEANTELVNTSILDIVSDNDTENDVNELVDAFDPKLEAKISRLKRIVSAVKAASFRSRRMW